MQDDRTTTMSKGGGKEGRFPVVFTVSPNVFADFTGCTVMAREIDPQVADRVSVGGALGVRQLERRKLVQPLHPPQ